MRWSKTVLPPQLFFRKQPTQKFDVVAAVVERVIIVDLAWFNRSFFQ
jgi:hypothetical protein